MVQHGIAHLFAVTIDGHDFGTWTECNGLTATYAIEEYEEGGQNGFVHKLPGRLKYETVKLKRAVDASSAAVAGWFGSTTATSIERGTASITLFDANREEVATWKLTDVVPVRWSGPTFSTSGNSVATEELELAHHGFALDG